MDFDKLLRMDQLVINITEKAAGFYCIENYRIAMPKKPNVWHRFFMRVLLNFHWRDGAL